MSTSKKVPIARVTLALATFKPPELVAQARHFVNQMTGNPDFPNPRPTLATIAAQATALELAYGEAMTRARGSSDRMHAVRKTLSLSLHMLATQVRAIANVNPDNAAFIIQSAGMNMSKAISHTVADFDVRLGRNPQTIRISNKALKNAIYVYQMTTDPKNQTGWSTIYTGMIAKFIQTGLSSGTRYYFRYAVILKGVQGSWSPVLSLMVA
jgi:hypothetical protein